MSMEFSDRAAYRQYNAHPDHVRFVQERWLSEVTDFLESDYTQRASRRTRDRSPACASVRECHPS